MKRIIKIIFVSFFAIVVPLILASGQNNKSEQQIKVIVDDGSGTKTIIDTVYKDTQAPDSIKLKNGTVLYIKHYGEGRDSEHHRCKEHFTMTYSSNGKDDGKEEVIIISSDSLHSGKGGDNIRYFSSPSSSSNSRSGSNEGRSDERYSVIRRESREDFDNDSIDEKTRFVIAKDGMVVTIEGKDEAKAKELAREIESKLGVNTEGSEKKETVKVESKKAIKK
jgi:hypothetical protein